MARSSPGARTSKGMNLKATKPVTIVCDHVNYFIKKKQILFDVDTKFVPGELTALMGGSGAGKTTLLNVISGMAAGRIEGEVLINNKPLSPMKMKKISNLVPQLDVLIPVLTARETLEFAARIRVPGTAAEHKEIVDQLLRILSLEQCADVVCGNEVLKGLSGGQRKRVSVGLELMTNPAVLFLDEPTSGLDSKVAADVVRLLQEIASSGRTVVCTIHQPNFQVFNMFTKLLMLHRGRVVFDNKVPLVTKYLAESLLLPTPPFTNPADHFMAILAGDFVVPGLSAILSKGMSVSDLNVDTSQNADAFAQKFKEFQSQKGLTDKSIDDTAERARRPSQTQANLDAWDGDPSESKVSSFVKFFALSHRVFVTARRDRRQMIARTFQQVFLGLLIGSIYYQMPNTQGHIQDRASALFMILVFTGMSTIMQTVTTMPVEKAVVLREYRNGYYSSTTYFTARMLVILSLQVMYGMLYAAIVYPLVGFYPAAANFFIFFAALALTGLLGAALGFAIGTLVPTIDAAVAIVPMAIMPMSLFSGLLVQPANIPNYWIWLYYLSFFQYPYQIFMVNEFQNLTFQPCSYENGGYCPLGICPADPKFPLVPGNCSGMLELNKSNYDPNNMPRNFGILVGYFGFFLLLGCYSLSRMVKVKQ